MYVKIKYRYRYMYMYMYKWSTRIDVHYIIMKIKKKWTGGPFKDEGCV